MSERTDEQHHQPNQKATHTHPIQRFFVENRCRDFPTTHVHIPQPENIYRTTPPEPQQQSFLNQSTTAFLVDKRFDKPVAYAIRQPDQPPVITVEKTNITDVWQVYNGTLFSDIPTIGIGKVHTFLSVLGNVMFAFVPHTPVLKGLPTMQMEPVKSPSNTTGDALAEYQLSTTNTETPVGRVIVRRYFFDVVLTHCTTEETLLWLALLLAAELETKTPLVRYVPSC